MAMDLKQWLLTKLTEECLEVGQRALKQQQFGKDEVQKEQLLSNQQRLRYEVEDLLCTIELLENHGELPPISNWEKRSMHDQKRLKLFKYLSLSQELGKVEYTTEAV